MHRRGSVTIKGPATGLVLGLLFCATAFGQIPLATDAPPPLAPAESLKLFQLPADLRIELVAAEPFLADPVAMAFDEHGWLYVAELHGYNMEGYFDVLERNKQGMLDKAVARVPAPPEAQKKAAEQQYTTIKLLVDRDGDGRMDEVHVWANHLPPCYGLVTARHGVVALCSSEIVYLADADGDRQAEVRETLFVGFGVREFWSRINNPRWGIDNWIYAASGIGTGGTITGPHLKSPVQLDAICFRFKADGTALEPVGGSTSGFGQTFDDWGDRFLVTNQQHALMVAPLPYRYQIRNPYHAAPNPMLNLSTYGYPAPVFPTSQPDPWRLARSKDPAWVKFYGVLEATANGYITSACGPLIYRATDLPAAYRGNHFSADCAQNMLHRCLLDPSGVVFQARRPVEEQQREFLTSRDQWFRPVSLELGPEGGIYIVDMYRSIIEDYSAIPRHLQQVYIKELIAGADKGRVYRIVAARGAGPKPKALAVAATAELVEALAHPNAWRRETAQRLLVERQARDALSALRKMLLGGPTPQARLHALCTLDGLQSIGADDVVAAMADGHARVRAHAMALAEPLLAEPAVRKAFDALATDADPHVRMQYALSVGNLADAASLEAHWRLAQHCAKDTWLQAAILCGLPARAHQLLLRIIEHPAEAGDASVLARPLGSIVGARRETEELRPVLAALCQPGTVSRDALAGLAEGLQRGRGTVHLDPSMESSLEKLLGHADANVRVLASQIAFRLNYRNAPNLRAQFDAAIGVAQDARRSLPERVAAMETLERADFSRVAKIVQLLLDPHAPLELQLASVRVLATQDDSAATAAMLADWDRRTPPVQAALLEALFGHQKRLLRLLDAIDRKRIPWSALDANRRQQLISHPNTDVRHRAESLLSIAALPTERRAVLAPYQGALAKPRDPARGKLVFEKQCSKCHQVRGQGFVVGPDLSVIARKSDEMLLSDVLDPNNQITVGFNRYTVVANDGKIFEGVLAAETATSIILRKEQGVETTLLRTDIDEIAASAASMMPEGLEKEVTPQDLADLIAFLREAFR